MGNQAAGLPAGAVVVGVDGSTAGRRAVDWATSYALAHRSEGVVPRPVVVAYATGRPESGGSALPPGSPVAVRLHVDNRRHGLVVLDRATARVRELVEAAGLPARELTVHTCVLELDPRVALLELAERAHLLVVGDRGNSGVDRLPVGSVSSAVAALAPCPVVVVPAADHAVRRPVVVVGVHAEPGRASGADPADGPGAALEPVLGLACREAAARGVPLVLLAALPTSGHVVEARDGLLAVRRALGEEFPDVDVHLELAVGTPAGALLRAASEAALVVVGRGAPRHARPGSPGTGALAAVVAEQSPVPVAVVPAAAT